MKELAIDILANGQLMVERGCKEQNELLLDFLSDVLGDSDIIDLASFLEDSDNVEVVFGTNWCG